MEQIATSQGLGRWAVGAGHIGGRHRFLDCSWRRVGPSGTTAFLVLTAIVAAALIGPWLWGADPTEQNVPLRLLPPSGAHPLGTDQFGRDVLARVLLGARYSLLGALAVSTGVNLIGLSLAAMAVFGGRLADTILGRVIEMMMAVPWLVTALGLSSILGASLVNLLAALILTGWPWYARTYRTVLLKELGSVYVEASIAVGASPLRIVLRHILPNVAGSAIVLATANLGGVLLSLTSLSFLGLGVQPPTPEWGSMINDTRLFFQRAPWLMLAPGLSILATALAVNVAGDALRDFLDPRTRT